MQLTASKIAGAQASKKFEAGVRAMPHLEVMGEPEMCVVGFKSARPKQLDIFRVNDRLSAHGWHLCALQMPSALHMCFTAQHIDAVDDLLKVGLLRDRSPPFMQVLSGS